MKKYFVISFYLLFLIIFSNLAFSQILFDKKYAGGVTTLYGDVVDDGFIFAGHYYTGNGYDAALVRIDSLGTVRWSYKYGGNGSQDGFRKIRKTSDNCFLAAGYTNSFQNDNYWNFLVCKIDSSGAIIWGKEFGGIWADEGWDMMETSDGCYVAAGYTKSFGMHGGGGSSDIVLVKFSKDGDILWKKVFGTEQGDWIYSMTECNEGGILLTGNTYSPGNYKYFISLIKVDQNGNLLWSKFLGSTSYADDYSYEVKEAEDGSIYLTGILNVMGVNRTFLIKTDPSGTPLWTKIYGGFFGDAGYSFEFTSDGGFIIGGYSINYLGEQKPSMLKLDADANIDWMRMFADNETGAIRNVKLTHDGTYIGGGFTNDGSGLDKTYLVKTDEVGNTYCNSAMSQPASSPIIIQDIQLQFAEFESDSFITVTLAKDSITLLESNSCELPGSVQMQSFNHSINNNAVSLQWSTKTEENNTGFKIYRNQSEVGFIEGSGTTTGNHNYTFTDSLTEPGRFAYKIEQVGSDGSSNVVGETHIEVNDISLSVLPNSPVKFGLQQNYPNPFNPETLISYSIPENNFVSLKVYDLLGKEIAVLVNEQQNIGTHSIIFDGSALASGIYYYVLKTDKFTSSKKMVLLK